MLDAARGIEAMHALGLIHNDIATRNILYETTKDGFAGLICDFGLATEGPKSSIANPLREASPNGLNGQPRTPKDDVWMFASALWMAYCRQEPHFGYSRGPVAELVRKGKIFILDSGKTPYPEIDALITDCNLYEESKRPTMTQVVARLSAFHDAMKAPLPAVTFMSKEDSRRLWVGSFDPKIDVNTPPGSKPGTFPATPPAQDLSWMITPNNSKYQDQGSLDSRVPTLSVFGPPSILISSASGSLPTAKK